MLLLSMLVLCMLSTVTKGCSCLRAHPQETLCHESSFAMLVKIRSWTFVETRESTVNATNLLDFTISNSKHQANNSDTSEDTDLRIVPTAATSDTVVGKSYVDKTPRYRRYRIKIYKAYKGVNVNRKSREKFYIYTATSDSLCGVELKEKSTYLVTGYIYDGRLQVSLCDYVTEWKTASKLEKYNIKTNLLNLQSACTCQATSCLLYNCVAEGSKECVWNKRMQKKHKDVQMLNFLCIPNKKGKCDWNNTKSKKVAQLKRQKRRRRSRARLARRQAGKKHSKRASDRMFLP